MTREAAAGRDEFRTWQRFTTRWADNDAYGHVNNTIFYQWFDSAVNGWLVEQDMLDIANGNPIALVAETRCSYFEALAFPQEVEVGLTAAHVGGSSIRYRIGVFGIGSKKAAAQGEFLHVVVDRDTRRPVDIPASWRARLKTIS